MASIDQGVRHALVIAAGVDGHAGDGTYRPSSRHAKLGGVLGAEGSGDNALDDMSKCPGFGYEHDTIQ